MQMPHSMREALVDDLDEYLENVASSPDSEAVVAYVIELLETYADDAGIEEVVARIEEDSEIDGTLSEVLEEEISSNDEFEYTGEELVSLLERLCDIDWEYDDDEEEEEDDEDYLDDDEEEDEDE